MKYLLDLPSISPGLVPLNKVIYPVWKKLLNLITPRANNCQMESQGLMSSDLSIGLSA